MNGFRTASRFTITVVTLAALASTFMVFGLLRGTVAHASTTSNSFQGHLDRATLAATTQPMKLPTRQASTVSPTPHKIPYLATHKHSSAASSYANTTSTPSTTSYQLLENFNGISSLDSARASGLDVEPPDQGLCVGNGYVVEMVNLAVEIYHRNGTTVRGPVSLSNFFGEPVPFATNTIISDPRCYYDKMTNTWFATVLFADFSHSNTANNTSRFDVAVNSSGDPTSAWRVFHVDTTDNNHPGCPCFGDQPLLGSDQYNVYVSANEFSITAITGGAVAFNGAQIYAISKSQLVASNSANVVHFDNLGVGGTIAASVQPAISYGNPNAEYFLNSLDPFANFDNRVGVWAMTNRQQVTSGGMPNLTNVVIRTETYGQPPVAQSPGGVVLNTDDDRMQQVQYINGQLWSSLNTALTISGETGVRSAAAWFDIHPFLNGGAVGGANVTDQGYVASRGNYLLYPAVATSPDGTTAMVMSLTGPDTYPSAVVAIRPATSSGHRSFNGIRLIAGGATADHGFTCQAQYGGVCRWGDYSAAVLDPSNNGASIWMATEYIPGTGDANANWGTRIAEVQS